MGILEKIEVIRQKPEHIRLRYVWFLVFFCMFFVVFIWFFSLKNDLRNISRNRNAKLKSTSELQEKSSAILEEIEKQKEVLKSAQQDISQ
jgi:hypothetical protein